MNAFAPRRTTETQISGAITLGWRIAVLYSLRADELPSAPPDNLLPMRRSLPAAERLALELRAAAGDADRLGLGLDAGALDELLALAARSPGSDEAQARFREAIRAWHISLQTMLWAAHEATGKAYELGSFLSDTSNRVVLELRHGAAAHGHVTRELRCVFASERVERIKRLLDDLQARIDPAAVRIVSQHLAAWQDAVRERTPRHATRTGLEPLDSQAVTWFQLVTGDKEPEAFIGHDDRARVRETMVGRMVRSYKRNWRTIGAGAAGTVALAAGGYELLASQDAIRGPLLASLGPLTGALGLSFTSIGLTVRKSLDARAELLWNTALVEVISTKTLRVDDMLAPAAPRRSRLSLTMPGRRSRGGPPAPPGPPAAPAGFRRRPLLRAKVLVSAAPPGPPPRAASRRRARAADRPPPATP
jgi:hypothetical protein